MSEEIEREIESTRPDERENPALRVPAIRRARDRSPHACDPTVLDAAASRGRSRGRLPFSPAMVSEGGESAVRGHVSRGGHGWVARAARDKARTSPTIMSAGCLRAAALQNPAGHARRTLYYA